MSRTPYITSYLWRDATSSGPVTIIRPGKDNIVYKIIRPSKKRMNKKMLTFELFCEIRSYQSRTGTNDRVLREPKYKMSQREAK
jgi:hypothetical protein